MYVYGQPQNVTSLQVRESYNRTVFEEREKAFQRKFLYVLNCKIEKSDFQSLLFWKWFIPYFLNYYSSLNNFPP